MSPTDNKEPPKAEPPKDESPPDPPHFVHYETAYGSDVRLSFAVRVF